MNKEIIISGFGGQGILFAGRLLAYTGLVTGRELSWLPSYGPEMRGGTANCHVIISDAPVASPMITNPDSLVVMNLPSLKKFEGAVKPGGHIIIDETLIKEKTIRTDCDIQQIPATQMALDMGAGKLANIIMVGRLCAAAEIADMDILLKALEKCVPPHKAELLSLNAKALEKGFNFSG